MKFAVTLLGASDRFVPVEAEDSLEAQKRAEQGLGKQWSLIYEYDAWLILTKDSEVIEMSMEDAVLFTALRATSTEELLTNAYSLTHQIHSAQDHGALSEEHAKEKRIRVADLRAQRDILTNEIIRRSST